MFKHTLIQSNIQISRNVSIKPRYPSCIQSHTDIDIHMNRGSFFMHICLYSSLKLSNSIKPLYCEQTVISFLVPSQMSLFPYNVSHTQQEAAEWRSEHL